MTSIQDFKNPHSDQQKMVDKKILQGLSEQGHLESSEENARSYSITPFI